MSHIPSWTIEYVLVPVSILEELYVTVFSRVRRPAPVYGQNKTQNPSESQRNKVFQAVVVLGIVALVMVSAPENLGKV